MGKDSDGQQYNTTALAQAIVYMGKMAFTEKEACL